MASRPSRDGVDRFDQVELEAGMELTDAQDGANLHLTYVSDDTVVALTQTGMIALPRAWVESDLKQGSVDAAYAAPPSPGASTEVESE